MSIGERLRNMTVARKLVLAFGIICGIILIRAIITVSLNLSNNALQRMERQQYRPVQTALTNLNNLVTHSRRLAVNWVYIDHQPNTPDKLQLAAIVDHEAEVQLTLIREKINDESIEWSQEIHDTLGIVNEKVEQLFEMERTVMSNLSTFDAYDDPILFMESEMLVQSDGDVEQMERTLSGLIDSMQSLCDARIQRLRDRINYMADFQLWFAIIVSAIIITICILAARLLYNSIVGPLQKAVQFAGAVGEGDLTATIEYESQDEVGKLCHSLRGMVENLKESVLNIEANSNELVSSSLQLKDAAQKISKGASEQAASAEQVSTAIEQMVANIDQNTENAVATEKITSATVGNVNESSQNAAEAAEQMKGVAEEITIISDIAFQTNILALNAAVEAVRAGEMGRGFSVVATEVRKLAERSKAAAAEIVGLVGKGLKVSTAAGDKALALVPEMEKTTVLIKEISAASLEQKTGAEQINMAMQNLNIITQENASASDEMSDSAQHLNVLAGNLMRVVQKFKVDDQARSEHKSRATEADAGEAPMSTPTQEAAPTAGGAADQATPEQQAKAKEAEPVRTSTTPSEDAFDKPAPGGVKINLGNIPTGSKEFDMDSYEKF